MDSTEAIKETIQNYFDGSYFGDGVKMDKAFHKAAHIYGLADEGGLTDWHRDDFVAAVGRPRPEGTSFKRDHAQQDEILSIEFTGENTAVARVTLRVGKTFYTDILCLLYLDGQWGIIAKLFSGVSVE